MLPAPTITDAVDAAVEAINRLVIFAIVDHPELLTADERSRIVEADYLTNTVQDAVQRRHGINTD